MYYTLHTESYMLHSAHYILHATHHSHTDDIVYACVEGAESAAGETGAAGDGDG